MRSEREQLEPGPAVERKSLPHDPVRLILATIVVLGVILRVYFLIVWHPALLGYPDGSNYMLAAHAILFGDPVRVAGYVLFLRFLHLIWPHLILVTITQHGFGIASGLLLYDTLRRAGAPRALGLVPAAVVILGGFELMLEHEVLTDSSFVFLVDLSLWLVVRAWRGSCWWALAAGLSLGMSVDDRTVGLELLPFMLVCLCIAPAPALACRVTPALQRGRGVARAVRLDGWLAAHPIARWRALMVLAGVVGALVPIISFLVAHDTQTGAFNFTSAGNLQLYGRVAQWADCKKFTPPPGTADLCIKEPVPERPGYNVWEYSAGSPIRRAFGTVLTPGDGARMGAFAEAAVEGQPLTYAEYVLRDLARVVDPSFPESPYSGIGNYGDGNGPQGNVDIFFNRSLTIGAESIVAAYYRGSKLHEGDVGPIKAWERATRLEGPAMAIALLLALVAPFLATGFVRRVAILQLICAAALIIGPILVLGYDYRYVVPGFGPLTAAAAIGAYELWRRARRLRRSSPRGSVAQVDAGS
jgi:hypothetical protein